MFHNTAVRTSNVAVFYLTGKGARGIFDMMGNFVRNIFSLTKINVSCLEVLS
jgi:hypothetical protein